jgi:oleate hydratase
MITVYHHFDVKKEIPPLYHGLSDPKDAWSALKTAFA